MPGGGRVDASRAATSVSGRWRFGSGCREATWLVGNFDLETRTPARVCIAAACGSTSDDQRHLGHHRHARDRQPRLERHDVFVPDRRVLFVPGRVLLNQWQRWHGTLYPLPVHTIIGPHHSMIATASPARHRRLGGAGRRQDAARPRGRLLRDQPQIQDLVARAEAHLGGGRAYRDGVVSEVWATAAAGQVPGLEQFARCRLAGEFAADSARTAMDLMFRAGGTTSTQRTQRLAHCWRDLQVVGQAAAVNPDWYPVVGRHLLGLEPGTRLTDK